MTTPPSTTELLTLDNADITEIPTDDILTIATENRINDYKFALALAEKINTTNWNKSRTSITAFLDDIAHNSNTQYKDSKQLRYVKDIGNIIISNFNSDTSKIIAVPFDIALLIVRSRLVKQPFKNTIAERKKQLNDKNLALQIAMFKDIISDNIKPENIKSIITLRKQELTSTLMKEINVYNNWSYGTIDKRFGMLHNGQIPGQIILNTIYHYAPKQARILDPMAGGGTTHDVCQWLNEQDQDYDLYCTSFDLSPRTATDDFAPILRDDNYASAKDRSFIIQKDILTEDWDINDLDLIFLDPPYYSMVADGYVKNQFTESLASFYNAILVLMEKSYMALKPNGYVAYIMQPMTVKDIPDGENYIDLPYESMKIMESVGFKPWQRIQTPLPTQQFLPQQVNKAKWYENRERLLGTSRDLIIMKKV